MTWLIPDGTVFPDLYATPADYSAWTLTDGPDNLLPILRACSALVAEETDGDWYDTDPATGLPLDPRLVGAFRDATCIQAAAWVALGIDPMTGGVQTALPGTATTRKIGSASITRSDSEAAAVAAAVAAAQTGLVPDAVRILRRNGLASPQIWPLG